jgi:threonine dehydrogenase-like Zn-dependent dehydrogenase
MRAVVMQDWKLRLDEVADPQPGPGQVLTKVLACGICGSDLHLLRHGEEARRLTEELAADEPPDPLRPIMFEPEAPMVMGHEFCCEVVDVGPGVQRLTPGDVVVSMPAAFDADGVHALGFSNRYPGGYAELMVLNEMLALDVPTGLPPDLAALTEPLAVGVHAVAKSGIGPGDAAIVLGLGPVGLACIAELERLGIGPVVGADFSAKRRSLAEHLGCDIVVDPAERPAIAAWRDADGSRPLVVFEAVGVPGMLDAAMRMAPKDSRILVVGVCMQPDEVQPLVGIGRELNIQFALGYQPDEFAQALRSIADGEVDLRPLITGTVGVDGVPQAFEDLGHPDLHAKILVQP